MCSTQCWQAPAVYAEGGKHVEAPTPREASCYSPRKALQLDLGQHTVRSLCSSWLIVLCQQDSFAHTNQIRAAEIGFSTTGCQASLQMSWERNCRPLNLQYLPSRIPFQVHSVIIKVIESMTHFKRHVTPSNVTALLLCLEHSFLTFENTN